MKQYYTNLKDNFELLKQLDKEIFDELLEIDVKSDICEKEVSDYVDWLASHNGKCNKNYAGSSNSESSNVQSNLGRSVKKHGLRYTTML